MDSKTNKKNKLPDNARIKKLEQQQEEIRAAIARERSKLVTKSRTEDTRRKILAGNLILTEAKKDPALHARLYDLLASTLTRPDDRALFGFALLPGNENEAPDAIKKAENENESA